LSVLTMVFIARYSYDHQNRVEFCVVEYVDSPGTRVWTMAPGSKVQDDNEEEKQQQQQQQQEDEEDQGDATAAKDLSKPSEPHTPVTGKAPAGADAAAAAATTTKRKIRHVTVVESAKRKKPFHCKPCNYQAENEEGFVEHLGTHAMSKMRVVNHVEGRSRLKPTEAGGGPAQESEAGGGAGGGGGDVADCKGVICCERCGYNTNRYDHYVAHLKHHNKEGEDHRYAACRDACGSNRKKCKLGCFAFGHLFYLESGPQLEMVGSVGLP